MHLSLRFLQLVRAGAADAERTFSDLLAPSPPAPLRDDLPLGEALQRLLASGAGALPVVDALGRFVGAVTSGGVLEAAARAGIPEAQLRCFEAQGAGVGLRAEQLQAILDATAGFAADGDWEAATLRVMGVALEQAAGALGFSRIAVEEHGLKVVACDADLRLIGRFALPHLEGLYGQVVASGRPLRLEAGSEGAPPCPGLPRVSRFLGVPVRRGDQTLGVIAVADAPAPYGALEQARLEAVAGVASALFASSRQRERERILQERLRQSQKLEALGRLAGSVAHDFNNMLMAINGYSDLALRSLGPADPLRESLNEIRRAGERAATLTRQLLAFSRRQVLEPRVVDLNGVVRGVSSLLRRLIGENVKLVTRLEPRLGKVKVDPAQIEQVLMNLAVNARDAMPDGGVLTLETSNLEVGEGNRVAGLPPGSHVMLRVTDTGTGMDEATRARLFEPFFTTKGPAQGTGLGLAIVYGIVKQSGGHIWVDSEPGRYTSFRIYLPHTREEAASRGLPERGRKAARGSETILVVEDEQAVRAVARRMLEAYGYKVLEAGDGEAALRLSERHPGAIDLLFSDVVMPRMSGRPLAERLASLRPGVRTLYTSGYIDDAIVHHGVLERGVAYRQKPYSAESLARKVREVLDAA
jgi:signal transduction histidine kinase/ActR/RegA family two-component response regulator